MTSIHYRMLALCIHISGPSYPGTEKADGAVLANSLLALVPVLALIGTGFAMKARTFLTGEFWPQAEKLCYYVLLPALFIYGTANAGLSDLPIGAMAPVLAGSVVLTAVGLALVQRRFTFDGPAF